MSRAFVPLGAWRYLQAMRSREPEEQVLILRKKISPFHVHNEFFSSHGWALFFFLSAVRRTYPTITKRRRKMK